MFLEGMIILVSGQICLSDSKERNFSQVFALDKKKGISGEYYVIKHDMLHIMEIPEVVQEFVEEIVEEEVSEEAPEEIPKEIPEEKVEPKVEEEIKQEEKVEMIVEEEKQAEAMEVIAEKIEEQVVAEKVEEQEKEEVVVEEKQVEEEVKPEEEEKKEEEEVAITEKELMAELAQQKEQQEKKAAVVAEEKKEQGETPAAPVAGKPRAPAKRSGNFPRRAYNPRYGKQSDRRVEKSSDGFVVETGRFKLQKDRKVESTVYVSFDKDGMNREALIQLFKVG